MASFFTKADTNNFRILVDQQRVVHRRNALLSRVPHVASHTVLKVRKCADEYVYKDPVYMPPVDEQQREARRDLEDLAVVTDWKFTRVGCDHTVSCNPFYPNGKRCAGMPHADPNRPATAAAVAAATTVPSDGAFSFRTMNGQVFDACQPICYDGVAASTENMVGVTSRFRFGKCRVYDPVLLAFYLDPTLRYLNPDTQILERKAFVVDDVSIEPYEDAAVLLASIPTDYCDQYGAAYTDDGDEQGIAMHKCGDNVLTWSTSWLLGESVPKLAAIAYDKSVAHSDPANGDDGDDTRRFPPTESFLSSRELWSKHVDDSKRSLPFPLRLSDLGIVRGTRTEWLVWTDEYSALADGRNDVYGGRLVERDRPVPAVFRERDRSSNGATATAAAAAAVIKRVLTAGGRFGYKDPITGEWHEPDSRENDDNDGDDPRSRLESSMLKSLAHGAAEYQHILNGELDGDHTNLLLGLGTAVAYDVGYRYLSHKTGLPTSVDVLKSAFRALRHAPTYARKVSAKMVGYWASKAAVSHTVEAAVTRGLVKRLKTLMFAQVLGPLAVVIDVIALIGTAVDIVFVLLNAIGVSTPVSRRESHVSDRRLYRLAQTEIEFNLRMYGVANIELTPFRFAVNTPYLSPAEDVQAYMALMPIVYTARELNSDGGRLKPDHGGGRRHEFDIDDDGVVHFLVDGSRRARVGEHPETLSGAERLLRSVQVPNASDTTTAAAETSVGLEHGRYVSPATTYYAIVIFISTVLIGYFQPSTNWTIAVALLVSVLLFAFPLTPQHVTRRDERGGVGGGGGGRAATAKSEKTL